MTAVMRLCFRLAAVFVDLPVNTVVPAITTSLVGSSYTLTTTTGTWTGATPITYTYQWCLALLDGNGDVLTDGFGRPLGVPIVGQTGTTYVLRVSDIGEFVFCEVTAVNVNGSAVADSDALEITPFFVFIAGTAGGSADSSSCTTPAIDSTGADLLVLFVEDANSSARSISDSKSNTWTPLTDVVSVGNRGRLYYSKPTSVGSGHTFHDSGSSSFCSIAVGAFAGSLASPFDVQATGSGTSSTASAGSGVTPTTPANLVIAGTGVNTGSISSIDSSFSIAGSVASSAGITTGAALAYKIQSSTTAADPNWTLSGSANWSAAIASFKSA